MGMPEIPEFKHRPSLKETFIDLMESIALEEIAISHLINAEAEKIQAFVGKCLNFPSNPTNQEIIQFNLSVKQITDTLLMKEWLLLKKLETVSLIKSRDHGNDEFHHHPKPGHNDNGEGHPKHDKEKKSPAAPNNPALPPEQWDEYEGEE